MLIGLFLALSIAFCKDEFDFRKVKWGMSKQSVIESESDKDPFDTDNALYYKKQRVGGFDADLFYFFSKDSLVRAKYVFIEEHSNENDHINDYTTVKDILTSKYGEPSKSDVAWKNNLFRNNPDHKGLAVSIGHLVYYSLWKAGSTTLIHVLSGDNYKIKHVCEYTSVHYEYLTNKDKEIKNKDDF